MPRSIAPEAEQPPFAPRERDYLPINSDRLLDGIGDPPQAVSDAFQTGRRELPRPCLTRRRIAQSQRMAAVMAVQRLKNT